MNRKHFLFLSIFILFFCFGLFLFYKSIKEIKEMEKETSLEIPSIEKKEQSQFKESGILRFKDLKGKEMSLEDFKGKIVFITFWATWCGYCARELPSIQKIYEEYKKKGIEFITISAEEQSKVEKYMNYYKYTFKPYIQISSTPENFRTQGIPSNFILDREGKIIKKIEGYFDWSSREGRKFLDSIL